MTYKHSLIMVSADIICRAIEDEMTRLGRNISNEEVQQLLFKLTKENKAKFLGVTEMDGDLLTGNLRENKIKVLNLNEEQRRKQ